MKKILITLLCLAGLSQAAFVWIGGEITTSAWDNQYNWAITGNTSFGGNDGHWGSKGPGVPGSDKWDTITLNKAAGNIAELEGWNIKLRLISSTLTVDKLKKFQVGENAVAQLDIDSSSILTFRSFADGNDGGLATINCDGVFNLAYTKNQGGDGFAANLGKTGIMNLTSSSGEAYTAKIKTLSASLETDAIRGERSLITLGDNMSFDSTETTITVTAADNWEKVNNEQEAEAAAEAGRDTYWITKDGKGIFLSWLKGKNESVPEPSTATLSLLALAALAARRRR